MVKFGQELEKNENITKLSSAEKIQFIEQTSMDLLANPEEQFQKVNSMLFLLKDSDFFVCKLSALALAEIFKDILPMYKIDKQTVEDKLKTVIPKEERKTLTYEYGLLALYEKFLHTMYGIHSHLSKLIRGLSQAEQREAVSVGVRMCFAASIHGAVQEAPLLQF